MIEVSRIVEYQSRLYAEQATSSYEKALYLESLLEATKPKLSPEGWPSLIAAPFRYPLPVAPIYQARFRPPFFSKNVLYAARELRTALYEHAYHFLRERVHLKAIRETGQRRAFSFFILSDRIADLHTDKDRVRIMDRRDYTASHRYIQAHPEIEILCYPSCRDPQHEDNFAIFDLHCLDKRIGQETILSFYFEPASQSLLWMDQGLRIAWPDVY